MGTNIRILIVWVLLGSVLSRMFSRAVSVDHCHVPSYDCLMVWVGLSWLQQFWFAVFCVCIGYWEMGKPVSSLLPVELEISEKPISHPCLLLDMGIIPHIPLNWWRDWCCGLIEMIDCLCWVGLPLSVDCDRLLLLLVAGHSVCSQFVAVIL